MVNGRIQSRRAATSRQCASGSFCARATATARASASMVADAANSGGTGCRCSCMTESGRDGPSRRLPASGEAGGRTKEQGFAVKARPPSRRGGAWIRRAAPL
ncbi:hypothetical protein P873_05420 [Arenimonas composti TR7-09 = DSM 18010]|uniref:Uncharacterized protein n=1 Tax=Arenimonas composti TR7-09 = DSM 18010 TaxID=1121013 RepID=A0A091C1Q1_9GAMM|nr:hypothetical protein P873_05420 [Arenimonas composti TR7-09 = DSM 18010]